MLGGERELLFVDSSGKPNVLPILDSGEWEDSWVLVMPRAERSLRQHLVDLGGSLNVDDAVNILKDIATGLVALSDEIVHRDLKPENVLLYEDHWHLADFGIARYAEATTATETWKHAKTLAYAAPEQWRSERATAATDVYAMGVVAYELIEGEHPFKGPEDHHYREQHLHVEASPLSACPTPLSALVAECLLKIPGARPTADNILARLEGLSQPRSAAAQRLQQVDQKAAQQRARAEARASAQRSAAEKRDSLALIAEQSLGQILEKLWNRVTKLSPQSDAAGPVSTSWSIKLMNSELAVVGCQRTAVAALDSPGTPAPFDVIAHSGIFVRIPPDRTGYEGRSHSLWFCDAHDEGRFRWYETAFMFGVFSGQRDKLDPFGLHPGSDAGRALAPIAGTEYQSAWPFTSIDQGQEDEFFERWIEWFATGAEGELRHPSHMPERDPKGSWRSGE